MFVARQRELALLEDQHAQRAGAFVPIYGRRRVGKTELIRKFLEGRPGIYHVGKEAPAELQLQEFLVAAAEGVGDPLLARLSTRGWKDALETVVARWKQPTRLVIALDEFQWTAAASPELPLVLQELWDRQWRDGGRVMLILCGSYLGFMEREVLGRRSPLFGRRTAQIRLQPFNLRDARLLHPSWSLADVARARFICGGVPLYLRMFQPERSIRQNVERAVLDDFAPLRHEADFLLREELREVPNYHAVLVSLARGSSPLRDIAAAVGLSPQSTSYHLDQLIALGYVSRRYPLTATRPAARTVRFTLDDPLLRFWFRFVFPNTSLLAHHGAQRAFAERIAPGLASYFGSCFERLAREALPFLYEAEGVGAAFEVGEYWDKHVQVDVVSLRDDARVDLGECKWGSVSPASVREELASKVARWPNTRGDSVGRWVFAREGIPRARAEELGLRWVGLDAMYGEVEDQVIRD